MRVERGLAAPYGDQFRAAILTPGRAGRKHLRHQEHDRETSGHHFHVYVVSIPGELSRKWHLPRASWLVNLAILVGKARAHWGVRDDAQRKAHTIPMAARSMVTLPSSLLFGAGAPQHDDAQQEALGKRLRRRSQSDSETLLRAIDSTTSRRSILLDVSP